MESEEQDLQGSGFLLQLTPFLNNPQVHWPKARCGTTLNTYNGCIIMSCGTSLVKWSLSVG